MANPQPGRTLDFDRAAVVIPVMNERSGIERTIRELLDTGFPRERIMVVDGHSSDGTPEAAASMGVRVIVQNGTGKADAIRQGIEEVLKLYPDTECIAFLDGDCTYPPSYIPILLNKLFSGYDFAIGWRKYIEKGAMNVIYRFGNRVITTTFNILFGCRLHDVLSGMYAIKTSVAKNLDFEFKDFSIESEIAAYVTSSGYRVAEVPVHYRKRCGKKKLGIKHGLKIFIDIIRLTWRFNPVFLIFIIGSLMLIPGLGIGVFVAYNYFFTGVKYYVRGLIAILLTLTGSQSLLLAILSLYLKRLELRLYKALRASSTPVH